MQHSKLMLIRDEVCLRVVVSSGNLCSDNYGRSDEVSLLFPTSFPSLRSQIPLSPEPQSIANN